MQFSSQGFDAHSSISNEKKAQLKSITAVKLIEIFINYIVYTFNVPLQVMLSESSTKPWSQEQYSRPSEPTAHCCVQLSFEQVDLAGKNR